MTIETKEERLQQILLAQQDSLDNEDPLDNDDPLLDDVSSEEFDEDGTEKQEDDKGGKDNMAQDIVVNFKQIKLSPDELDNSVIINEKIKYEVEITGTDLRLAEWKTGPKEILVLPNKKDVFVSIIDDNKTEITLTGNRSGTASLNLILKDENNEYPTYSTNLQINVSSGEIISTGCAASNCAGIDDLLTIRSESMQWPNRWEDVSKYFIVHLRNEEGRDVQYKEVELILLTDKSRITVEPIILKSDDDIDGKTRTNKYGIAIFKVRFQNSMIGELAVFQARTVDPNDPDEFILSKEFYVEITNEKLASPKIPATLNGVLSYQGDNYCISANLILGQEISESTQVGFYFNDELKMLPCTDQSAISVKLDQHLLKNGIHYISFFTVDVYDNVKFSPRERIIIDNSVTGECDKKIKNIVPKPNISATIPQICDRYFNSMNIRLLPTMCLQVKNRVAQMNIQKLIIIFNGYSKHDSSSKQLVYRSTMEIYADDIRVNTLLTDIKSNAELANIIEFKDPVLNNILADALPNIEVGFLGIQVMVFETNGDCYLCSETMYTVYLH
ncbi:hypothetical protein [Proteus myxofaciens]|uniref:Uncharacterized protein n=1 Tax=Proteus myxofaciens ATCC 19692 TaxID=1354337 RepID=A0A198GFK6_9GAMM|nr:hypothetical protein [Proteus myxofaciens]OAT36227.1 hypothetical protein M983_0541 [Proteus myxofaciens ATCC 19692]